MFKRVFLLHAIGFMFLYAADTYDKNFTEAVGEDSSELVIHTLLVNGKFDPNKPIRVDDGSDNCDFDDSMNIDSDDEYFETYPLLLAVEKLDMPVVALLLKYGADPKVVDAGGNTIFHELVKSVYRIDHRAPGRGSGIDGNATIDDVVQFIDLLKKKGVDWTLKNKHEQTPLAIAVGLTSDDRVIEALMIEDLVKKGPNQQALQEALLEAIYHDRPENIALLLLYGVQVNEDHKREVLEYSMLGKSREISRDLIKNRTNSPYFIEYSKNRFKKSRPSVHQILKTREIDK